MALVECLRLYQLCCFWVWSILHSPCDGKLKLKVNNVQLWGGHVATFYATRLKTGAEMIATQQNIRAEQTKY